MSLLVYGSMEFAEKLDRLIDLRRTNQSELSRKTGISQSAISEMTKGKRRAYMDQSFLLARALDVSLDYLADDAQEQPTELAMTDRERQVWEIVRKIGAERVYWWLVESAVGETGVLPGGHDTGSGPIVEAAREEPPVPRGQRDRTG